MGLPNPSMTFTPFDILTAQEMNDLVENDQALAAGTGFDAGAIPTTALANGSVTAAKVNFGGAGSGIWWEEIGRATLSSTGTSMSVPTIAATKYLKILITGVTTGGTFAVGIRFNNDSGNNYNYSTIYNNSSVANYGAFGSVSSIQGSTTIVSGGSFLITAEVYNPTLANKQVTINGMGDITNIGNGYAPNFEFYGGKWTNNSASITRVDIIRFLGTGSLASGAEVIVLGHN